MASVDHGYLAVNSPLTDRVVGDNVASSPLSLDAALSYVHANIFGTASSWSMTGREVAFLPTTNAFHRPQAGMILFAPGLTTGVFLRPVLRADAAVT